MTYAAGAGTETSVLTEPLLQCAILRQQSGMHSQYSKLRDLALSCTPREPVLSSDSRTP